MRRTDACRLAAAIASTTVLLTATACAGAGAGEPASAPARSSATKPAGGGALAWAPPALEDPQTVDVGSSGGTLNLDSSKDYIIKLPARPIVAPDGLSIVGGHNVVLIGGEIFVPPDPEEAPHRGRGLLLERQTGTVHVEGVRLTGPGLTEGIDLAEPEAVVQLENIHVDDVYYPAWLPTHPDVIQSWSGPRTLRVDGLTAATHYQGIFLAPDEFHQVTVTAVELRRVQIDGLQRSGYLLWGPAGMTVRCENVWLRSLVGRSLRYSLHPLGNEWSAIHPGRPPVGEFVPKSKAGTGYRSPGYET